MHLTVPRAEPGDVVAYYDRYFREGMVDLSASSAPPIRTRLPESFEVEHSSARHPFALREAIAARYETLTADDVLVTAGASEALVALANALLDRGDNATAAPGTYPSFAAAASRNGATLVSGQTCRPGSKVLLVTNPTVPDGRILDTEAALDSARATGAVLIADEVYRELAHRGSILAAADLDESAVSVADISKPLGLGGLRVGWIASRNRALTERVFREAQLLSAGPSTLSAAVAVAALHEMDGHLAHLREQLNVVAPAVYALLRQAGWAFAPADAGVTIAATPPQPLSEACFSALREANLFLLPGAAVGRPDCVRLNLLAPTEAIEQVLEFARRDQR